jgi:hypothetical protein
MKGITYKNTKTTLPGWVTTVHNEHPRGYAYETDTHFVHMYGRDSWFFIISIGLTAIQEKSGTLLDWVKNTYGAEDITDMDMEVGHSIKGVWRPSLYYYDNIFQALDITEDEMRLSEYSLRLLVEKLDEIFLYIEPSANSLNTYSHKTRELLILACTEVENLWQYYMRISSHSPVNGRMYTTKDYVKLGTKLHLKDFEFRLKTYAALPSIRPFANWDESAPTASLGWYDAYNKTKHDRDRYFSEATLINCINAVVSALIMHCVKFSPFPMFEQTNTFASLINQHFDARFVDCNPKSFYLHKIELPADTRKDLFVFDPRKVGYTLPFTVAPLTL